MLFIELEPPSALPRGVCRERPLRFFCGAEKKFQLYFLLLYSVMVPAGVWMRRLLSWLPASIRQTLTAGSALSRFASTQPEEPAPTMM